MFKQIFPAPDYRLFFMYNFFAMKSLVLSLLMFVGQLNFSCSEASVKKSEPPKPQIAEITFENERVTADTSDGKSNVNVIFKFKNTGTIPLVINEVKGNCHCVQGKWPEKPVSPGDSSTISVSFDPEGVAGSYQRTLMVQSNASRPSVELFVMGEITRDPKDAMKKTH